MTNFPRPVLSALIALLLLTACDPLASTAGPGAASPTTTVSTSGASGSALAAVSTLTVKGRGPRTGYARAKFGPAWQDVDHNGCDTRNDILGRDLTGTVFRVGTHGCVVTRGSLQEPYTGRTVAFVRGPRSSAVQIDHVVALSDAWQKGAAQWPAATRLAFANDPLNLLAVDGPANMAKGDGDAATWLPPNKPYRCAYTARQVAVKAKYHLNVTTAERAALIRVLSTCPALPLPR